MTRRGTLEAIWIKRARRGPMDPRREATLVTDVGLTDNADQRGRRQVTIIEHEVWTELSKQFGVTLDPSLRRANLMVSGIRLADSRGRILRIGPCLIRINGETKPCERMDEAYPSLQQALYPAWRGGAYGEVLHGGRIATGDSVSWVKAESESASSAQSQAMQQGENQERARKGGTG